MNVFKARATAVVRANAQASWRGGELEASIGRWSMAEAAKDLVKFWVVVSLWVQQEGRPLDQ